MILFSCCFQSEHSELYPRPGELGVQGDSNGASPDQDGDGPGCGSSVGEHSPHSPIQIGDHGSRLQPADGGQLHGQVGADSQPPMLPTPGREDSNLCLYHFPSSAGVLGISKRLWWSVAACCCNFAGSHIMKAFMLMSAR